jgi:hypothetical protein
MAFGPTCASANISRRDEHDTAMRSCALVFFNDIIICNASYEDDIKHLKEIETSN